jgi:hypothetical protein
MFEKFTIGHRIATTNARIVAESKSLPEVELEQLLLGIMFGQSRLNILCIGKLIPDLWGLHQFLGAIDLQSALQAIALQRKVESLSKIPFGKCAKRAVARSIELARAEASPEVTSLHLLKAVAEGCREGAIAGVLRYLSFSDADVDSVVKRVSEDERKPAFKLDNDPVAPGVWKRKTPEV